MNEPIIDSKYFDGQCVYSNENPGQKLLIRRYYKRIYYCRTVDGSEKEYAFFEREISPDYESGKQLYCHFPREDIGL